MLSNEKVNALHSDKTMNDILGFSEVNNVFLSLNAR